MKRIREVFIKAIRFWIYFKVRGTSLRRRRSKPSVYKWFRRVRGPAATQATRHQLITHQVSGFQLRIAFLLAIFSHTCA